MPQDSSTVFLALWAVLTALLSGIFATWFSVSASRKHADREIKLKKLEQLYLLVDKGMRQASGAAQFYLQLTDPRPEAVEFLTKQNTEWHSAFIPLLSEIMAVTYVYFPELKLSFEKWMRVKEDLTAYEKEIETSPLPLTQPALGELSLRINTFVQQSDVFKNTIAEHSKTLWKDY